MAQELILMNNVESLGSVGDKVRVADGYARNFLIPQGLAVYASKSIMRQLEAKKVQIQNEIDEAIAAAKVIEAKLADTSVTIPVQADEEEKLFGSITNVEIYNALSEDGFDEIERRDIVVADAIKQLGVYEVEVKLHKEVTAKLKVWVVKA